MFSLRPYQEPIADRVFSYMRNNKGKHPLVALPTGAGKTVVLSDIILKSVTKWPNAKILVLSHTKEILEQDYKSIKHHTELDVGLYSAGLNSRSIKNVTVAGIQSVHNKADLFQDFRLVIIDECHLIPDKKQSMYQTFFAGLDNPRYFGLTATPFRLGKGYIYGPDNDTIFDDLVYDLTSLDAFNKLVSDGYLCKLRTKATGVEFDLKGIKTVQGDYDLKGLSERFDNNDVTVDCVKEIIAAGGDYKKWLIFAIDIRHAEHIAEILIASGVRAMVIHSKMDFDRDQVINDFKKGVYKAIVNVDMLTTGFDDPEIDLIAMLRPTQSPVLHVQTIGRGLRIAPGKDHCMVLDFAGNTIRLGPINDVHVYTPGSSVEAQKKMPKACPVCKTISPASMPNCVECGYVFPELPEGKTKVCKNHRCQAINPLLARTCHKCGYVFNKSLNAKTGDFQIVREVSDTWREVTHIEYSIHEKPNRPPMLKVQYYCGLLSYNEFICIEHPGYAGYKAGHWVKFRGGDPVSTQHVMKQATNHELREPKKIKVDTTQKYPSVSDYFFE
jgi:DNA repair protein RadD